MTGAKYLEKKLTACLRQAESAKELAERGIAHIRQLLKTIEDEETKQAYRRQLRRLRSIVRSCKSEMAAIQELLRMLRGEAPKQPNGYAPPPPPPTPPPPLPTTIRVFVPKGLQIPDEKIKELVLKNLNRYAKEAEA